MIVVVVVSVIGFQAWYQTFQSSAFSSVERNNVNQKDISIETIIGTNLYLKGNFSIKKILVDGNECIFTGNISGVESIDISDCLIGVETLIPEIMIQTRDEILSKKIYLKNTDLASISSPEINLNCILDGKTVENGESSLFYKYTVPYNNVDGCIAIAQIRNCTDGVLNGSSDYSYSNCDDNLAPSITNGEWILVFKNSDLGINTDFYVMKYEAKNDGSNNPISSANIIPWTSISQIDSRVKCSSLGNGYHLITDPEWVTLGRQIEQISDNWANNNISSLVSDNGGLKRGNVGITNSVSYDGSNPEFGPGRDEKAMLILKTGENIWDMSGNVWEWTNDTFDTNLGSALSKSFSNWYEWTTISNSYQFLTSENITYNSNNAIGMVFTDIDDASPSGTIHGFIRGGDWGSGINAGVYALSLNNAPSHYNQYLGFRCSFNPLN